MNDTSKTLISKIYSISSTGMMKVKFNEPILIPSNYAWFNNSVINIEATTS
jgi:hypothetical protein